MCLAQGHNAVTPVRLEPAAPRSRVKHSTTEPLRSLPLDYKSIYECEGVCLEDHRLASLGLSSDDKLFATCGILTSVDSDETV